MNFSSSEEVSYTEDSEISEDTCNFTFKIKNYSLLTKTKLRFIESDRFCSESDKTVQWCLRLYPSWDCKESKNCISLYLKRICKKPFAIKAHFTLAIIDRYNNRCNKFKDSAIFCKDNSMHGQCTFIKNEVLFKNKETLLPDDTLEIFCSVTSDVNINTNSISLQEEELETDLPVIKKIKLDISSVSDTLENMYVNDIFTDITFIVDGKELKAHKCLLAASSQVFASILKNDKKMDTSVVVSDISYEVMEELLHYVYTKKVNNNLNNMVHELIYAANKYGIQDLKSVCEEKLIKSINMESILKLVIIAYETDAEELYNSCIDFIRQNGKVLYLEPEFKKLSESYPNLLISLFWKDIDKKVNDNNKSYNFNHLSNRVFFLGMLLPIFIYTFLKFFDFRG